MNVDLSVLNQRRKELGMSYADLAKRSGVSLATVVRILSGKFPQASFVNIEAIARELGLSIALQPTESVERIRERQAVKKACALVAMVQGNSGLEAQGVPPEHIQRMRRTTVHELMAGSSRRLWSE
jgi:transcriptional regulator with XRE-family HTH domain